MAPKLLWITIVHVLLWNTKCSLSESVESLELNGDREYSSLRDRVRYTTHICEHLKKSPLVNNHGPLSDSVGVDNPGLAKDSSEPLSHVKRHAIRSRCSNHAAHENNEPNRPAESISSEWQMKSTPVNDAHVDLHDHFRKTKVVELKKIDISLPKVVYQEPVYPTVQPQKGNIIGNNPKHSLLQVNLQDKKDKIKSLISSPQHKLSEIIPGKLLDESLHNRPAAPPLSLPSKFIKYPVVNNPYIQPAEIHHNVDAAAPVQLMTDNDKPSDPSKLSPALSPQIPNNNVYQKDFTIVNNPLFSHPVIKLKPAVIDIFPYDIHVPLIDYRPTPLQLMQTPFKPIFSPKEVSKSPENQRPQANIGSSLQYPNIMKNGVAEPHPIESLPHKKQQESIDLSSPIQSIKTSDPETANNPITIIEKKVSIYFPHKKHQELFELPPPKQLLKTSDTGTVHQPIAVEKEVSSITATPNEQKQPIVDLTQQAPQLIKTSDKESINQENPGQVSVNEPYEQNQPIIGYPSPPQITETYNSESTPEAPILAEKEVSISAPYGQQLPRVTFPPYGQQVPRVTFPPIPQIKIQKEISIPFSNQQKFVGAPLQLFKPFNADLISQSISQKKNSFYEQPQQPIILPSPPPLTKTSTSNYAA